MPGTGFSSGPLIATVSPIAKISGWPGTVRSGSTSRRPARPAGALSHSAAGEARTPAAHMMGGAPPGGRDDGVGAKPLAAVDNVVGSAFGDRLSQHDFDADAFQRPLRVG